MNLEELTLEQLAEKEAKFNKRINMLLTLDIWVVVLAIVSIIIARITMRDEAFLITFAFCVLVFVVFIPLVFFSRACSKVRKRRTERLEEKNQELFEETRKSAEEKLRLEKERHMRLAEIIGQLPEEYQEALLAELPDVKFYMLLNVTKEQSE